MISTLVNYRLYAEDMQRSLARVAAQPAVERDAAYYSQTIGSIDSVDALMDDRRLYTHALKAYGLSELNDSQALVRKILESDLSDPASFVNRLSDARYRSFAGAFDFVSASAEQSIQSQGQSDRVIEAYSEHRIRAGSLAGETTTAYQSRIAAVRTVDQLLADPVLFQVVTKIAGVDPAIASRDYLRGALAGGITDNPSSSSDDGLVWLSQQFNFSSNGTLPADKPAQESAASVAETISRYHALTGTGSSPQAAAQKVAHFEAAVTTITSADALVDDPVLFNVMMTAFGFVPSAETPEYVRNMLASEPNAPPLSSLPANTPDLAARKAQFVALNAAFGFDASGNAAAGTAIAPAALADLVDGYYKNYASDTASTDALKTNSFRVRLSAMDSIDDVLRKDGALGRPVLDYVLKAFDLDPATVSISMVRRVLTSDPSDPNSFVGKLEDPRWSNLASAFNFDAKGKVRTEQTVQSVRSQQAVALDYAKSFGDNQSEASKAAARTKTERYLEMVGGIGSLDEFLQNQPVVDYALQAFGLTDEDLDIENLRSILTSDLADPASFANVSTNPAFRELAASFNFLPDGRIGLAGDAAQRPADVYSTQNLYLLQMLEEQAGQQSEGSRLALYFLRKGPEITSPLSILADKALFEVVRTALGLPVSMSQQDIDRQVATLESRLDIADFSDPKKLDQFISRFTTLYDLENGTATTNAPILALFGGGSSGTVAAGITGLF